MNANKRLSRTLISETGLTLIETLIALAIFSIGILGVAQLQMRNVKNNTTGNITTLATMAARTKLEELKNIEDVTDLVDGDEFGINADGTAGGIFDRNWRISNPHGGNISRQIVVTVEWDRRGQNRSVALTTITKGNGT